jgi:hypothetical protein
MAWTTLDNGDLLDAAAAQFDVFITVDQNIRHQQNLATLPLSVVVLVAPNNRLKTLESHVPSLLSALPQLAPRSLLRIDERGVQPPSG